MEDVTTLSVKWGIAHRSLNDAAKSGDLCVVQPFSGGIMIAVLDGAGHGSEASAAVTMAAKILEAHAGERPISLLKRCHEGLRDTRGAALTIASIRAPEGIMTWSGVGNVEGILVRGDRAVQPAVEGLVNRPGVVGRRLPPLAGTILPIEAGDTVIFTTDGVSQGFTALISPQAPLKQTADLILERYAKTSDDALVVVARCEECEQ